MKNLLHYARVAIKILRTRYSFGRYSLFIHYVKYLFRAFLYARKITSTTAPYFTERLFGFTVTFSRYAEFIHLFEEIFVYEVYRFTPATASPIIIDAGSNIGMSVMYFKLKFPGCSIMAFEPERNNFEMLTKNITANNFQQVVAYPIALSDSAKEATLVRDSSSSLNWRIDTTDGLNAKERITTNTLSTYINDQIDLLKIDVEGSEFSIISDLVRTGKVKLIQNFVMELHPAILGNDLQNLLSCLSENGIAYTYVGEHFLVHTSLDPMKPILLS